MPQARDDFPEGYEDGCDTRIAAVRRGKVAGWNVVFETREPEKPIAFKAIRRLHARDKTRSAAAKLAPKLNSLHMHPKGSDVMKVKRAAQILSSSVATGLRMEREEEYRRRLMLCYESRRQSHITGESLPFTRAEVLDYAQTKELEVYIGVFNRMLDIMNARTPVVDVNDPRLQELLGISTWFENWWREIDRKPGLRVPEKNARFITQKLFHDLKFTLHAFVQHCKDYLRKHPTGMVFPCLCNQVGIPPTFDFACFLSVPPHLFHGLDARRRTS